MRKLCSKALTIFYLLLLHSFLLEAKDEVILRRVVCPTETSSSFIYDDIKAKKSDRICSSGTSFRFHLSGDTHIVQEDGISIKRLDGGPHRAQVNINWASGEGIIKIDVEYRADLHSWGTDCDYTKWTYMYTYEIIRGDLNPGGDIMGESLITSTGVDPKNVRLNYLQDSDYPENVASIRWWLGDEYKGTLSPLPNSNRFLIDFTAFEFKNYTVRTEVLSFCDNWLPGPSKTISLKPTCYLDNPASAFITITGPEIQSYPEGHLIQKNKTYTVVANGITDFDHHYNLKHDGKSDIDLAGRNFSLRSGIGSYRIDAEKLAGRSECPALNQIKVFVNGKDEKLEKDCPIIIPNDLISFGYTNADDPSVREHFAALVTSKSYIIVKPGMTLTLGAEIILDRPQPQPEPEDPDAGLNFVQNKSYDEYGRIIGETRTYYDSEGKVIQVQSKNFADGVVIAAAVLYDVQGRPVIQTLPAPVGVSTRATQTNACGETEQVGEDMRFDFRENFVSTISGAEYKLENYDLSKEFNPDPVGKQPGTLGWYYSDQNGTIGSSDPQSKMNEPLVGISDYPYTRQLYHKDGSAEIKSVTRPVNKFNASSTLLAVSDKKPADPTDIILHDYLDMRQQVFGYPKPTSLEGNFFIAELTDEKGFKSITYSDKSGATIIAIYSKGTTHLTKSYTFYDDAGRLIAQLSPNGVAAYDGSNYDVIDKTTYHYNERGLMVTQEEPDGGKTEYVYRNDGNIRFSQNEEQERSGRFSYTDYDNSGRPIESGEYQPGDIAFKSEAMMNIVETIGHSLDGTAGSLSEQVFTYYDFTADLLFEKGDSQIKERAAAFLKAGRKQRFVQGGVSCTVTENVTTWYSYDELNRIEWLVRDIKDLGIKTIDYRYGPIGSVQEVVYQKSSDSERFTHYYKYDDSGRLESAYITQKMLSYDKFGNLENPEALNLQATYFYYLHGPLKRIEYANKIQGIDYVYTVDGSLKSINDADRTNDPGHDTNDVFGLTLDYYMSDYANSSHTPSTISYPGSTTDQYGGNIKGVQWHSPIEANQTFAYAIEYDDRYQLKNAKWGSSKTGTMLFEGKSYNEAIGGQGVEPYDNNGNIQQLTRTNDKGVNIANYRYNYKSNTNKLMSVTDASNGTDHIFKYSYDSLGQMVEQEDVKAGTKIKVDYDVTGKVVAVRNENDLLLTDYSYDDNGFRVRKNTYDKKGNSKSITWYVRDNSGNVLSTYFDDLTDEAPLQPIEFPVYAGGRIGMYMPQYDLTFYEITDHLGNVRAVIGDKIKAEYLATMESERSVKEEDELEGFQNIRRAVTTEDINHTATTGKINEGEYDEESFTIAEPNEVMRMNNRPMGELHPDPIGIGKMLWVHPNDKVEAEVFVRYANFDNTQNQPVAGIAAYVASAFNATDLVVDGVSIFNGLNEAPSGVFSALGNVEEALPRAFLTYIVYDRNLTPILFDQIQVSDKAAITGEGEHERLAFEITLEKEGYVYIYVSNQSDQNMDVYFDDFRIKHEYSEVIAGGDYYPFGLPIEDRRITRHNYRHGYQGQFAERDEETGWNHFQLREYDPVTVRWTTMDPYRQYWSPYTAMGNSPANIVDPTGGKGKPVLKEPKINPEIALGVYNLQGIILPEVDVNPSSFDHYVDIAWYWVQVTEPDLYVNLMFKQASSNGQGKVTIPIAGGSFGLSKDGFDARLVTPNSAYVSYKANDYLEYRFYPAEGKTVPGEDANFRVLVMLHPKPLKIGNFEGKAQADLNAQITGETRIGARVVGEYYLVRNKSSVEISAGFRFKPRMFFMNPLFSPSLFKK